MKRIIVITKVAWHGDTEYTEKLINIQDIGQPLDELLADVNNQVSETAYQMIEDLEND